MPRIKEKEYFEDIRYPKRCGKYCRHNKLKYACRWLIGVNFHIWNKNAFFEIVVCHKDMFDEILKDPIIKRPQACVDKYGE